jgi:hypothetical protein
MHGVSTKSHVIVPVVVHNSSACSSEQPTWSVHASLVAPATLHKTTAPGTLRPPLPLRPAHLARRPAPFAPRRRSQLPRATVPGSQQLAASTHQARRPARAPRAAITYPAARHVGALDPHASRRTRQTHVLGHTTHPDRTYRPRRAPSPDARGDYSGGPPTSTRAHRAVLRRTQHRPRPPLPTLERCERAETRRRDERDGWRPPCLAQAGDPGCVPHTGAGRTGRTLPPSPERPEPPPCAPLSKPLRSELRCTLRRNPELSLLRGTSKPPQINCPKRARRGTPHIAPHEAGQPTRSGSRRKSTAPTRTRARRGLRSGVVSDPTPNPPDAAGMRMPAPVAAPKIKYPTPICEGPTPVRVTADSAVEPPAPVSTDCNPHARSFRPAQQAPWAWSARRTRLQRQSTPPALPTRNTPHRTQIKYPKGPATPRSARTPQAPNPSHCRGAGPEEQRSSAWNASLAFFPSRAAFAPISANQVPPTRDARPTRVWAVSSPRSRDILPVRRSADGPPYAEASRPMSAPHATEAACCAVRLRHRPPANELPQGSERPPPPRWSVAGPTLLKCHAMYTLPPPSGAVWCSRSQIKYPQTDWQCRLLFLSLSISRFRTLCPRAEFGGCEGPSTSVVLDSQIKYPNVSRPDS